MVLKVRYLGKFRLLQIVRQSGNINTLKGGKKMSNKIRQAIEEKGLKISHVISETGLAKSSFYEVMNGNSIPSLENARTISRVIGVPLDELFPEGNKEVC